MARHFLSVLIGDFFLLAYQDDGQEMGGGQQCDTVRSINVRNFESIYFYRRIILVEPYIGTRVVSSTPVLDLACP
jgi:hypothetical protein